MPEEKAPSSGGLLAGSVMHFCSGWPMHFCSGVDISELFSGDYLHALLPLWWLSHNNERCPEAGMGIVIGLRLVDH